MQMFEKKELTKLTKFHSIFNWMCMSSFHMLKKGFVDSIFCHIVHLLSPTQTVFNYALMQHMKFEILINAFSIHN